MKSSHHDSFFHFSIWSTRTWYHTYLYKVQACFDFAASMLGSNEASAHVTFFRDAMGFGGKIFFLPNKCVQQNTGNALHPPAPTLDHKSTYSYVSWILTTKYSERFTSVPFCFRSHFHFPRFSLCPFSLCPFSLCHESRWKSKSTRLVS